MSPQAYNEGVRAAEACRRKFDGKPFEWGATDCVRLAAALLRERGHTVSLAKVGGYSSEAGALRALKRTGFATLIEAVDAQGFPRIAAASACPGDLVGLVGPAPWGVALFVRLSQSLLLGPIEGVMAVVKPSDDPEAYVTGWRID